VTPARNRSCLSSLSAPFRPRASFFAFALALSFNLPAVAQTVPSTSTPSVPRINTPAVAPSTTILPTDVLPLPSVQNRLTFGENFQLRILQRLPARFYFTGSAEGSFRYETNVFQFPTKRALLRQLPPPQQIQQLPANQRAQISNILSFVGAEDIVFRVLPNVTGGITLNPRTRIFANYFMISDTLAKHKRLDTVIHSYAGGIQRDIPLGQRANLQAEFQFRELNQTHQQSVFDFLPGLTLSYVVTPRVVVFANALLQMRGKKYFQAPTKEIDPFYTWGGLYQRNGWNFSATSTLVQNFREPFRGNATIPVNNYAFILDFEVGRRLIKQLPGLQAFVRAEPIFNFASHNRPGLAGTDFRLFWGLRMAVSKPSLTAGLEQLKQQIEEQEGDPPEPQQQQTKPSAFLMPYEVVANSTQPIHGMLPEVESEPVALARTQTLNDSPAGEHLISENDRSDRQSPKVSPDNRMLTAERPVIFVKL
jgi:hypothetical protein